MEGSQNNSSSPSHRREISDMSREEREAVLNSIPRFSDAIRSHVENLTSRREGRSIRALSTLYDLPPEERDCILREKHAQFKRQLRHIDDEDDPLQIYVDYLGWLLQMRPENSFDSRTIDILKRTTIRYVDDPRYKDDARYLGVWLEYAEMVPQPGHIFNFLMTQKIGQKLAKFYERYAEYYESLGKLEEANQVYELGIAAKAVPLERLKRSHMTFRLKVNEWIKRGEITKPEPKTPASIVPLDQNGLSSDYIAPPTAQPTPMPLIDVEQSGYLFSKSDGIRAKLDVLPDSVELPSRSSSPGNTTSDRGPLSPSTYRCLYEQQQPTHFKPENNPVTQHLFTKRSTPSSDASHREYIPATSLDQSRQRPSKKTKMSTAEDSNRGDDPQQNKKDTPNRRWLESKFLTLRSRLIMREEHGTFKEYIHVTQADLDENVSFEEARARNNQQLLPYTTLKAERIAAPELPAVTHDIIVREENQLTEETRAAMQSVNAIITKDSDLFCAPDEEDLTWNRPYQFFKEPPIKIVNENDVD